jgi:hypothetical protein
MRLDVSFDKIAAEVGTRPLAGTEKLASRGSRDK